MVHNSHLDYGFYAKVGFLLGVGLLAIGGGGELVGNAVFGSLPQWEETLFFDLEVIGLLVGFFSPLTFGIVLPLMD